MRSVLITAAVLAALVAGFVVFLLTQKSSVPVVKKTKRPPATMPTPRETVAGGPSIGGGEGGWVQAFDKKSGELVNEFRADHFDPMVNNRVHVVRPDARFYGKDGQVLTLSASTGDITMAESARKTDRLGSMQGQPPSHGVLYDVKLGLLENADATTPVLSCTLPIVAFDNDTLRLNTIPMTANGQEIAADRVPVTVRGRDYDFDGQGLTVRYNQRDRRLEFLEVAHGIRLVIKNPKAFGGGLNSTTPTAPTTGPVSRGPLMLDGNRPIELVTADPAEAPRMTAEERERRRFRREAAARRAAREKRLATSRPARPASTRPQELVAYRASFNDAVTITEAGVPVGNADRMVAAFTFEQNGPSTRPTVAPSGDIPATTAPARRRRPTTTATQAVVQPTTGPATRRARRPSTRPLAATQPAGPIEIKWTGKLTVVPQKMADSGLRSASDRIVEFTGKPVSLRRQGSTITAAYVWAAIDGNRFRAAPDATTPRVTLTDAGGTVLTTESIEADGDDAILHGRSSADVVLADATSPDGKPKQLRTTWTEFATIRTAASAGGRRGMERASFRGNVKVDHPQLKMTADVLALGFAADAGRGAAQLSAVRADGRVKATVTGDDGATQNIAANTLDLGTAAKADGTLAVRSMRAHGNVVAGDSKQTLRADDLEAKLSGEKLDAAKGPASMAVESLSATGQVNFTTTDGATAVGDRLTVETIGQVQWVTLGGTPATVTDPQSSVTGHTIRIDTAGSRATIEGAGSLAGQSKTPDGKPGQPIRVTWTEAMNFDGLANTARVLGDVVVDSRGTDGTINTAKGRALDIVFADGPTTKPAAEKPATSQPFGFAAGSNKRVKSLTLTGADADKKSVEISSLLYSPTEPTKVIRQTYLWSLAVTVNLNADGSPGAIDVPHPGTMLYEDVTPAARPGVAAAPLGGQGTVALEWSNGLHYDPGTQKAIVDGKVTVVRRAPGQDESTMLAPRLVAEVDGGATPQGAQLKRLTADQGATLLSGKMRVDTPRAVFEPALDRLIATGSARTPVRWSEEGGINRGSFEEIWWNLKTNQPDRVKNVSVEMNR